MKCDVNPAAVHSSQSVWPTKTSTSNSVPESVEKRESIVRLGWNGAQPSRIECSGG